MSGQVLLPIATISRNRRGWTFPALRAQLARRHGFSKRFGGKR
ncbi:hypothetical protein Ga0080574_TMP3750 [Salipiger abyssi]|uniref:Uncharacterized protein n=1 Tax=Salipiger abyssi TaxID=1250539 RepID=A0A1P8UXF9_9RHOB|nr:hypothetical protein Ga0080574_TMP3750 [Salipiger abyssi]